MADGTIWRTTVEVSGMVRVTIKVSGGLGRTASRFAEKLLGMYAAWATKNAQGVEVSDGRVSFNTTESNRCWPCKFRHCEAAAWRKRLAGKANASDTEVKAALLRLVRGGQLASLPKTNEHVRDAIGVALWAWWGSR